MKITKTYLKKVIKEEIKRLIELGGRDRPVGFPAAGTPVRQLQRLVPALMTTLNLRLPFLYATRFQSAERGLYGLIRLGVPIQPETKRKNS
jgi:hypothetical protein